MTRTVTRVDIDLEASRITIHITDRRNADFHIEVIETLEALLDAMARYAPPVHAPPPISAVLMDACTALARPELRPDPLAPTIRRR